MDAVSFSDHHPVTHLLEHHAEPLFTFNETLHAVFEHHFRRVKRPVRHDKVRVAPHEILQDPARPLRDGITSSAMMFAMSIILKKP
jgi:hypothetical protein